MGIVGLVAATALGLCGQRVDLLAGVGSGGVGDDLVTCGVADEPGGHLIFRVRPTNAGACDPVV
jgi:hypothetical protein